GWPGPAEDAAELAAHFHPLVDGVTVCLDVGETVLPRLGLELHLDRQPPAEPRWAVFLDRLVDAGWCTAEKRDGLLSWPGRVTPAGEDAPIASLEQRLSHV